jgi:hypothetical protein
MACAIIIFNNWTTYDTLWVVREVDITKWKSLGFHVKTNFPTCLKIGPQGDTHPTLVKTHNIYNVPHPTKLNK